MVFLLVCVMRFAERYIRKPEHPDSRQHYGVRSPLPILATGRRRVDGRAGASVSCAFKASVLGKLDGAEQSGGVAARGAIRVRRAVDGGVGSATMVV